MNRVPSYLRGMKNGSLLLLIVGLLSACGDGKKEAAEQLADDTATEMPAAWVLDLSTHDMPLTIDLGDRSTLGVDSATVVWNEEFGWLEVSAGERFMLTITEGPGDIERLKADLERDMLQKHTIIEETPVKVIYRSQFPDEDLVFVHFRQVITVGDRTFVVEDVREGRFNEMDIARMAGAVKANSAV